jgi:hypothetical protein
LGIRLCKRQIINHTKPSIQNTDFTGLITNRSISSQNILISNNHSSRDLNIIGYKIITSLDNDLYSYFENKLYYLAEPLIIGSNQAEVLQIDFYPEEDFFIDLITDQNTYVRTQVNLRSTVGTKYELVMEITDNASDSSTLRLNNGGDFAVVDWTSNGDFQEISTSAETESNVIPSNVKIFAKNGVLTYFHSSNNNFSFDISILPSGLTYYSNSGSNTTTGDIADLPSGLTYYYNSGSNTTSGDIADLPSGLTYFRNYGSNTTSGDIADLPSGLTYYYNTGSNTTSGDIADLPSGLNTYYNTGNNQVNTYTSGRTWTNNLNYVYHRPAAGYDLSAVHISDLLIDLSDVISWTANKKIDLAGNNSLMADTSQSGIWGSYDSGNSPSTLATALKTLVKTKGVTVILNGITIPGDSGDGTGFPAGFGDWWRI